ncbi:hypothetical protein V502_00548 [Pseudogymnoascus sp. VKM F-4520 (FW-2644)]|nr:hypothetical protein V502_00548 [Pseudogymnoascus sp. VKM F-4520 (FW-2644)]
MHPAIRPHRLQTPDQADFDPLSTILEIEQVRPCIWGQAVGLAADNQRALDTTFTTDLDGHLKDRRIAAAVSDVLKCIKCAIEDSPLLKRRYRLQVADTSDSPESHKIAPRTTFNRTLRDSTLPSEVPSMPLQNWSSSTKSSFQTWSKTYAASTIASPACCLTETVLHANKSPTTSMKAWMAAAASIHPTDMEGLVKQIEELEVQLNAKNKGMLEVSMLETFGKYSGFVTWDGARGDEWYLEIEKELEVVRPPNSA